MIDLYMNLKVIFTKKQWFSIKKMTID